MFGARAGSRQLCDRVGTIDVAEPPTDSSIYVEIETASFCTSSGQRDASVRSACLLDADPNARRDAWDILRGLRGCGTIVVLTTHYMDEAQAGATAFPARRHPAIPVPRVGSDGVQGTGQGPSRARPAAGIRP